MTAETKRKKVGWKEKVLRNLEKVEDLLPEVDCMQGKWPDWVQQMAVEVARVAVPGVKLGKEDLTANELGRLIGTKAAAIREVETLDMNEKQAEALERLLTAQWGEEAEEKFMAYLKLVEGKLCPAYERSIRSALAIASKQTPKEQAEFFKGYSSMIGENPDARQNSSTQIYFFMILYWKAIEAARQSGRYSVSQLHAVLCQIYGAHLVGDKKRIEKMCERKGLHFRKPGRPALPEKSDTKAA